MSLSAEDWILAGFQQLCLGGHHSLKIELLCKRLNVSKGSFYWHFKSIEEFKRSMLQHWASHGTENVFENILHTSVGAANQLRALVEFSTGDTQISRSGLLAETAIRDWAKFDKPAAALLKNVDAFRLEFTANLFQELGHDVTESRIRANLLYGALIGLQSLARVELAELRTDTVALLEMLLDD